MWIYFSSPFVTTQLLRPLEVATIHRLALLPALSICFSLMFTGCVTLTGKNASLRTPGELIDDQFLESVARRAIRSADERLKSAHVVVVSYNGILLLAGQVESEELRQTAQRAVEHLKNVRRVHNELSVGGPISWLARSNDSWLTSKVKAKLIAAGDVSASEIKVITENSVVYLLGKVSRQEADRAVEIVRNTFGVQKIVKIFDYLTT